MPLHEYKCRKCRHVFERIQKFSDKPEANCPKCNSAAERQLSAPAVHFKGTGWYVTDARKGKKDTNSEAKEKSSEKNTSDSTKKKDTKPKKND